MCKRYWWFIIVLIKGVWMLPWINGQRYQGFLHYDTLGGSAEKKLEQVGFFFRIL